MSLSSVPLSTRKIGADSVSAIGYGAMGIAAHYGPTGSDEERLKVRIYQIAYELNPRDVWLSCVVFGRLVRIWMHELGYRKHLRRL